MAITTKKQGVWNLNEVYEKIDQGSIWDYNSEEPAAAGYLWAWGYNNRGQSAQNNTTPGYSSPTQIGTDSNWMLAGTGYGETKSVFALKTDGTLWAWGQSPGGNIANVNVSHPGDRSSPTQIPGTTWDSVGQGEQNFCLGTKTDGTLWGWGISYQGELGNNLNGGVGQYRWSSPVQIPSTTLWSKEFNICSQTVSAIKNDGTLWAWGNNPLGQLGQNSRTNRSSPTQVPGISWNRLGRGGNGGEIYAFKNDGTLWAWGKNDRGNLGQNQSGPTARISSPTQIPGTNWSNASHGQGFVIASKSDGSLWGIGDASYGSIGQNSSNTHRSSPVRIPGTNWHPSHFAAQQHGAYALKTDGTLWAWGRNDKGQLGKNDRVSRSSPVQIPGTYSITSANGTQAVMAIRAS